MAETNLPGLITYAILGIGLIEELAKMIPFVLVIIHLKSFNEPIDGLIYASFIALGFAFRIFAGIGPFKCVHATKNT